MDVRDNPNRKIVRIPLAGVENTRANPASSTVDQHYLGWIFDKITNPLTGKETVYCEKTPLPVSQFAMTLNSTYNSVSLLNLESYTVPALVGGFFEDTGNTADVTVYTNSTRYTTVPTGVPLYLTETSSANPAGTITTITLISCDDSTAWFIPMDALTGLTFTANTNTNTTIDNISSMAGLWVGQAITGTDIPANTRITAINYGGNSITISNAATGTSVGITVTRTIIAKIIDSDFPTDIIGPFQSMNGYAYIMTLSGKVYNSDLNSIISWSSTGYISAQAFPDKGVGVFRYKNNIVAFGRTSIEFFEDVGNPTGSPLKSIPNATIKAGTLHARLIHIYGDSVYFVGQAGNGNLGLFEIVNFTLKQHINKKLSAIVKNNLTTGTAGVWPTTATPSLLSLQINYKPILLITFGTSIAEGIAWLFDPELKVFTQPSVLSNTVRYNSIVGSVQSIVPSGSTVSVSAALVLANDSLGNCLSISLTFSTNETIITSPFDLGTKNLKRIHKFRLIGDQDSTTNTMTISWSDDDGQNFSTARTVSMGSANPTLVNMGNAFRRRIFKIVSSTARAVRLEAIELEYSELDH